MHRPLEAVYRLIEVVSMLLAAGCFIQAAIDCVQVLNSRILKAVSRFQASRGSVQASISCVQAARGCVLGCYRGSTQVARELV